MVGLTREIDIATDREKVSASNRGKSQGINQFIMSIISYRKDNNYFSTSVYGFGSCVGNGGSGGRNYSGFHLCHPG